MLSQMRRAGKREGGRHGGEGHFSQAQVLSFALVPWPTLF